MRGDSPIIVALDVGDKERALRLVDELKDLARGFKVGLELVHRVGLGIIREIRERGGYVFYDGKFNDIPHTVAQAARACLPLGVWMLDVHSFGGRKMMEEAVKAVKEEGEKLGIEPPLVLAITVLTSLDEEGLREIGIYSNSEELVGRLSLLAKESGCDGVVASPREIEIIRERCGEDFLVVCPGIRLDGDIGDHKRFATPREALERGANYLVIGRPILSAISPQQAFLDILESIGMKG